MDIVVIGANGSVGREITRQIVSERLLESNERLQLVGRMGGWSERALYGFAVDLMDAYAEICPEIDIALSPKEVVGDLIVMAAGATLPVNSPARNISRDTLALENVKTFESYASALAKYGHGSEIVICISNPNELAVEVFAGHLGRKRVIGMGAYLDSLRFRKEIAMDVGVRRQKIRGFIAGEHGSSIVPLWSSVRIFGYDDLELREIINKIRRGHQTGNFKEDLKRARNHVSGLIEEGRVREAYSAVDHLAPDLRVALKSLVTHFSGAKTVTGTANATLELLRTIILGHDAFVSGQIRLEGEFYDICGTIGVPFVIGTQGVEEIVEVRLDDDERKLLVENAENINKKIKEWLS